MLRLRLVLCLSLILGPQLVFAQLKQVCNYSFLNIESNRIAYYGNSSLGFERIYKKFSPLIKTGKGQIRILHIGDSHLQADFFSGRVRANFQSILPGLQGARGVICPYMKGCPDSYKITYSTVHLGVAAGAVSVGDLSVSRGGFGGGGCVGSCGGGYARGGVCAVAFSASREAGKKNGEHENECDGSDFFHFGSPFLN